MKTRQGFVSNSSSSSFVLSLVGVSNDQIEKIFKYMHLYTQYLPNLGYEPEMMWFIQIYENHMRGFTYMNDIDMRDYLTAVGIDMKYASIEDEMHRDENWVHMIANDKTRVALRKHVGKYVAHFFDEIFAEADTYAELCEKVKNHEELNELKKCGDMAFPYITWVDPIFYALAI